jgi:mannose-1-phosphate guanylyltransferase
VRSYVERCRYPVRITTAYEETLLGTGGTLLKNRDFFRGEPLVLVHADNLSNFDLSAFVRRYEERARGIEITMMTFDTKEPEACGIVELDERGVVVAFHEKVRRPPGDLANGAVYVVSPSVVDFLAGLGKQTIDFSTEVLPHFMGRINTFHNTTYHRDIGTPRSLAAAQTEYPAALAGSAQAG